MKHLVGIYRAHVFSPNSVDKDQSIMDAVVGRLADDGWQTELMGEEQLDGECRADVFLSMGRMPGTLDILKRRGQDGSVVINSSRGVEACRRSSLERVMRDNGIPMPPREGDAGYWIKRGDMAAQTEEDVIFAADKKALGDAIGKFKLRGISDYTVSAHVVGDLMKFYGVCGTGFFRYFYPSDDGEWKFDDESHNGAAHHYAFDVLDLRRKAERLSSLVDTPVYGGDCIVTAEGQFAIIDFNDWPSFSRCREEAADAIASLVNGQTRPETIKSKERIKQIDI